MISFIIPVLNSGCINRVLKTIKEEMSKVDLEYEIIICDNGSDDWVLSIIRRYIPIYKILINPKLTIGAIRNAGAVDARGDVLVFIDADILITNIWVLELLRVIKNGELRGKIITGSKVTIPELEPSWIELVWFAHEENKRVRYINSGNLIIPKKFFNELGGFDEKLETGEDYEIAQRAKQIGGSIINNKQLKAIHLGYPHTIKEFFIREKWHGRGDAQLSKLIRSKPALIGLMHIPLVTIPLMIPIWVMSAISQGRNWKSIPLYGIYFFARGFSIIQIIVEKLFNVKFTGARSCV